MTLEPRELGSTFSSWQKLTMSGTRSFYLQYSVRLELTRNIDAVFYLDRDTMSVLSSLNTLIIWFD